MYWPLLALCAGLLLPLFVSVLPSLWWCLPVWCVLLAWWRWRGYSMALVAVFAALLGAMWSVFSAQQHINNRLINELDGRTIWLEGRVEGLSELNEGSTQFYFENAHSRRGVLPTRLRLSWQQAPPLINGETWRLAVKLRGPRGTANPHSFDFEAWLLARHVGAIGSVKRGERLEEASDWQRWRETVRARLLAIEAAGQQGTLAALVLGDASGLNAEGWQILQATGTTHLLVVSGQHITLLAGVLYAAVALLFRYGIWPKKWAWPPIACFFALSGALIYGGLAGWGVPVQRSCLMLALLLFWRWRALPVSMGLALLLVFCVVLILDPLASLQAGFWLSFGAVAILWACFSSRLGVSSIIWPLLASQWAMTIGLLPFLAGLGLPVSITGPLANLLAVPWVSLGVVPLALLGTLLLPIPSLAEPLLWLAGWQLSWLFKGLAWLSADWPAWQGAALSVFAWLLLAIAAWLLLLPRGVPLRASGAVLLLAALLPAAKRLPEGRAEVWMLDVGQGLSVLIRTRHHSLLYDSGPRQEGFDTGEKIVAPVLKGLGVTALDTLLLSHADNDHAGGAPFLMREFPITEVISGEPNGHPAFSLSPNACEDGRTWQWDGVTFTLWRWAAATNANDASCVLRIEAKGERLLLAGDISVAAEQWLRQSKPDLRAEWLVAAHHGSKSSSSSSFLRAVSASNVLISRGLHNSFSHPHPQILARYRVLNQRVWDTAQTGALQISLGAYQLPLSWREQGHFWQQN